MGIEAACMSDVSYCRPVRLETFLGDSFIEGPCPGFSWDNTGSDTAKTSLIVFSRKTAVCHGVTTTIMKITGHFLFFYCNPYDLIPLPILSSSSLPEWKRPYSLSSTPWWPYVMRIISSIMWKYCFMHVCTVPSTKELFGADSFSEGYWNIMINKCVFPAHCWD